MKKIFQPFLYLGLLFFCGCIETSGGGGDLEIIPDIQIECPGLICSASSATVWVGWIQDTSIDCESYLLSLNPSQYEQSFDALGSTVASASGPLLFGIVTSWVNYNGAAIGQIANGRYKICGHYDENDNLILDSGDAVGEMLIFPGSSPQTLEDWINF